MEGVSDKAEKVYNAMKSAGFTDEEKMANVDRITALAKLPKNFVINALQELERTGYAKRKAREKSAGYYIIK
ncbi:MAG: transcriptional regulator [Thermoplasmata archaeon]